MGRQDILKNLFVQSKYQIPKVQEISTKRKIIICGMKMAIKEKIHFNGQRLQVYVDYGNGINNLNGLSKITVKVPIEIKFKVFMSIVNL